MKAIKYFEIAITEVDWVMGEKGGREGNCNFPSGGQTKLFSAGLLVASILLYFLGGKLPFNFY